MGDKATAELRRPGYWDIDDVRDVFTRIKTSLEEAEKATTVKHVESAAAKGHACFCAATACQQGCPLGKEVPSIMGALREVDFKLIDEEFKDVQKQLDTYLKDFGESTFEDYFREARKGYIKRLNQIIDGDPEHGIEGKPELKKELNNLKAAYMLQVSASRNGSIAKDPFPEFTGKLCPAPCEDGGPKGTGCTLKESGRREPVRIRSVEYDLATIGFALGWMDEIFRLPASLQEKEEKVAVVGAGPAGLQAAYRLAMKGYDVTLMEKDDEIGGLMYRGIPEHKFEKERLVKYRLLLEQMGVKIELGKEIKADDLKGFDAKVIAVGGMDGQIEPTWINGYDVAKTADLTQDAYGFLDRGKEWAASKNKAEHEAVPKGEQIILAYGDGYTATDVVQTLIRMKKQSNSAIVPIHAFRDTGVSDQVAGGFSIAESRKDYQKHNFSTFDEDKESADVMTIPGANISKIIPQGEQAEIHFAFQKPQIGFANVARDVRRKQYEADKEAGGIMRDDELVGLRVRDANGQLHDHTYKGNGQFDIKPSADAIEGEVNGTLTLNVNRIIPALGYKDASKNPLVQELGMNASAYNNKPGKDENRDGIWNGVAMSQEGTFFIGDAAPGNEQLIVSAQASANKVADTIDLYLHKKRSGEEIDLVALASRMDLPAARSA